MHRRYLAAIFTVLSIFCLVLANARFEDGVTRLTDDNFDAEVGAGGTWLIAITASWCGHCRHLKPLWRELAAQADAHELRVASVEGPDNLLLTQRFGIQGYPSVFLIKHGSVYRYSGGRSTEGFLEFAASGYTSAQPLRGISNPLGAWARISSKAYVVPKYIGWGFRWVQSKLGLSQMGMVALVVVAPMALGGALMVWYEKNQMKHYRRLADEQMRARGIPVRPRRPHDE